jgi:hypothetical protein
MVGISCAFRIPNKMPVHIEQVPKVTINTGNLYFIIMNPFINPRTVPNAQEIKKATITFPVKLTAFNIIIVLYILSAATYGKDTSQPPDIITIYSASPNIPGTIIARKISRILFDVKNRPLLISIKNAKRKIRQAI